MARYRSHTGKADVRIFMMDDNTFDKTEFVRLYRSALKALRENHDPNELVSMHEKKDIVSTSGINRCCIRMMYLIYMLFKDYCLISLYRI